jgi:hypothetical protein
MSEQAVPLRATLFAEAVANTQRRKSEQRGPERPIDESAKSLFLHKNSLVMKGTAKARHHWKRWSIHEREPPDSKRVEAPDFQSGGAALKRCEGVCLPENLASAMVGPPREIALASASRFGKLCSLSQDVRHQIICCVQGVDQPIAVRKPNEGERLCVEVSFLE